MQFRFLITNDGKHPPAKWAQLATDEIIEISEQAPDGLVREAKTFKSNLFDLLARHHAHMMTDEQKKIKAGKHSMDLPLETEEHSDSVVDEICDLAKGTSFETHFNQEHVRSHLVAVCNRSFKSAKLVVRQHHHTEKERSASKAKKN